MKTAALLVLGLAASLGDLPPNQDHRGKIAWEIDPAAGLAQAKSQKRAALLYFTADW